MVAILVIVWLLGGVLMHNHLDVIKTTCSRHERIVTEVVWPIFVALSIVAGTTIIADFSKLQLFK